MRAPFLPRHEWLGALDLLIFARRDVPERVGGSIGLRPNSSDVRPVFCPVCTLHYTVFAYALPTRSPSVAHVTCGMCTASGAS